MDSYLISRTWSPESSVWKSFARAAYGNWPSSTPPKPFNSTSLRQALPRQDTARSCFCTCSGVDGHGALRGARLMARPLVQAAAVMLYDALVLSLEPELAGKNIRGRVYVAALLRTITSHGQESVWCVRACEVGEGFSAVSATVFV